MEVIIQENSTLCKQFSFFIAFLMALIRTQIPTTLPFTDVPKDSNYLLLDVTFKNISNQKWSNGKNCLGMMIARNVHLKHSLLLPKFLESKK